MGWYAPKYAAQYQRERTAMGKKILALKDIIWALCIVISLGALFIGFVIAATHKYTGEEFNGRVELGTEAPPEQQSEALLFDSADGTLHSLPETKDYGPDYTDGLTFLCDSALIGLRDYGVLTDGINTTQVWGSSAGNIPFDALSSCKIKYPADGSVITAAEAAMIKKPAILVISVGSDGLAEVDHNSFVSTYESLISSIQSASPSTKIICCSLTSVTPTYAGVDGLSAVIVGEANEWMEEVCTDTGVYFADFTRELHSSGYLMSEYAASNGKGLNNAGLIKVLEYLRTHAV